MELTKKINDTTAVFIALGGLALLGLVMFLIFGNLQGNVGFTRQATGYTNQTITLSDAGAIPAGASGSINGALTNVIITNATGGGLVPTTNYSTSVITISNAATNPTAFNGTSVNVSYTVTRDSGGMINTNALINNFTNGQSTFFGYYGTMFSILGVSCLIIIIIGAIGFAVKQFRGMSSSTHYE